LFQSHLPTLRFVLATTTTMAKTKEKQAANGAKRHLLNDDPFALQKESSRPTKKAKLLDDSDNSDAEDSGVTLKVNDEYAKRFEYNKKREEKHRRT
jgi:protein KRI1